MSSIPVSSNTFDQTDILIMKPATTLGGAITATEYSNDVLHAFFDFIDDDLADSGGTIYLPFYVKNINPSEDMINPRLLILNDTVSRSTDIAIGWDPAPVNQSIQTIASKFTAPTGIKWSDSPDPSRAAVLGIAIPRNGGYAGGWYRLRIQPGAEEIKFDGCETFFFCDNLPGDAPNLIVPEVPEEDHTIITGGTDINDIWNKMMENIMYSNVTSFIHAGNIFGNHTDNPPTNAFSFLTTFKDRMRKLTLFCFGQNEAKYSVVKNDVREFFGLNKTYYSRIVNNKHYIIMDTSDADKVPYGEGSDQYNWVVSELDRSLSLSNVHWRIVISNRAMYAANTSAAAKKYLDPTFRDTYHKLFQEKKVHLVIQQTWNNLQVLQLLEYNDADPVDPIAKQTGEIPNYTFQGQGFDKACLFYVAGGGGGIYDNITNAPSYLRYGDSVTQGYLDLRFQNKFRPDKQKLHIIFKDLLQRPIDVTTIIKE